jgi:hypothetical protein
LPTLEALLLAFPSHDIILASKSSQDLTQEGTMKLLFFDAYKLGVLRGETVIDVS